MASESAFYREAGPDFAQKVYIVQVQQPVRVIDRNRLSLALSEIDKSAHLLTEALAVVLNLLNRHHGTGIGSAGRISDHARAAAQESDRFIPRHLQPLHQAQCHKVAYMEAVRGRIESDVKGRPAVIDHLTDLFRIRQLREKASRLKLLINTHLSLPFLFPGFHTHSSVPAFPEPSQAEVHTAIRGNASGPAPVSHAPQIRPRSEGSCGSAFSAASQDRDA